MDLPLRIVDAPPAEPVVAVDGALRAPGLELSHWPGNRTPHRLKHELSTGIALAFARLDPEERAELARGCTAIVNTHYDTDGVLAMFAVRHPELALEHAGFLLDAAAAGDFFRVPSERALALDAIVSGLSDLGRSPLRARLEGLADAARHELLCRYLVEELPAWLGRERLPHPELWQPVVAATREELERLAECRSEEDEELDFRVVTVPEELAGFAPGRHALFEHAGTDRVLLLSPARRGGLLARLLVSTMSWFDLPARPPLPRPDLDGLRRGLDDREGTAPERERAWRAQETSNASPELWFGLAELERFAEHNPALRPSALSPEEVRVAVVEALRASPGDTRD